MQRVRLFHWRAAEAGPLIKILRAAGYVVDYPGEQANGSFSSLRQNPPVAAVIDLSRLPSHGRYVAAEIRARKTIRHIPIVFVDGEPEKIARIRADLPDAVYTTSARLVSTLKRVKPLANPIAPPTMMNRSDRTAAQKLGITKGMHVAVIDPPPDYGRVIGALPPDASLEEEPDELLPLTLWFVRDPDEFVARLAGMRKRAQNRIWIIYPKRQAGREPSRITQGFVREAALMAGLVDYKVCSVNETWTGLLFTRKS